MFVIKRVYRLVLFLSLAMPGLALALPDLRVFNFTLQSSKTLPAMTSTENAPGQFGCDGTESAADQLDRLALVVLNSTNQGCFSDGSFNATNFPVDKGVVADAGNTASFEAYRIGPGTPATQFVASHTGVYYQFPTQEDYTVYKLEGTVLSKLMVVPSASIVVNTFVKVSDGTTTLRANDVGAGLTLFFVPSSQTVSVYHVLATNVEGARIQSTTLGDLNIYRYDVAGTPYDTRTGFNQGPSSGTNRYADTRQHFNVRKATGEHGVLWQDEVTQALFITWFGANRLAPTTVSVPNNQLEELAAATHDDAGNVYYLTIQTGNGSPNTARTATLYQVDSGGALTTSSNLDTSAAGLNMVEFFNTADMHYADGKLGLFLARTMHQSGDGLNHQGGIAVVFNAVTLAVMTNHGQTSGHSWDNFITSRPSGEFLGIDLGDNFPRGVHLHKFTDTQIQSRIAFNFKTRHGETATNPAGQTFPIYNEISNGGTTYYQWSNDNESYSELAAVVESGGAFSLVFAAEPDAAGKAMNSARVGASLNDARDVALVRVRGDFENASGAGSMVSDDMVLSAGTPETGGFYSFTGGFTDQRNAGVVWLTSYSDLNTENASRVRAIDLADGNLLVFWEKWTSTSYVSTHVMKVDPAGTVLEPAIDLGTVLRFDRRGDLWRDGHRIYSLAGSAVDKKLELFVLEPSVSVTALDSVASEPSDNGSFRVTRSGSTAMSLTVNVTMSGTAQNGVDYQTVSSTLTIPAGAATADIALTVTDDTDTEGGETATLTVESGADYSVGSPASASITILDDEGCVAVLQHSDESLTGTAVLIGSNMVILGPNLQINGDSIRAIAGNSIVIRSDTQISGSFSATVTTDPCGLP